MTVPQLQSDSADYSGCAATARGCKRGSKAGLCTFMRRRQAIQKPGHRVYRAAGESPGRPQRPRSGPYGATARTLRPARRRDGHVNLAAVGVPAVVGDHGRDGVLGLFQADHGLVPYIVNPPGTVVGEPLGRSVLPSPGGRGDSRATSRVRGPGLFAGHSLH